MIHNLHQSEAVHHHLIICCFLCNAGHSHFFHQQQFVDRRDQHFQITGSVMASDAFFPFRDNIDQASKRGVDYVVQPGGSNRDKEVIAATDEYGMVMAFTGIRLFHH